MVAVFCVIFVTIMGVAWHHLASTIRTFHARSNQICQDQGAIMALAEAMRALEIGPPPIIYNTKPCYCDETIPVMQNLRLKYPESDKTKYPESPLTYYYRLDFLPSKDADNNQVYTVTVTKRPEKPTDDTNTRLNINDFGKNGPI